MQNELEKGILKYVDNSIENAPYTQIYTGLIKASGVDGYTIDLNGVEYTNVPSEGSFSTNDTVKVVIPNNQHSNMFILAESTGGGGTGAVSSVNGMTGDVVISNVASADKLSSAKTITLSGDATGSVSTDFSTSPTISVTVVDDSHNHIISNVDGLQTALDGKSPINSPTFTGAVTAPRFASTVATGTAPLTVASTTLVTNLNADLLDGLNSASTNTASTIVARDSSGNFSAGTITANLTGNSSTSTKLATARNISLSGDVTGSVSFDGSGNSNIVATVVDNSHNHIISNVDNLQTTLNVKADLVDGKVPSSQLPSFVDDVLEYATLSAFPVTGTSGVIYVDLSTNLAYRWSGTVYVEISPSLALGETSSTAYRGDRGVIAYNHSLSTSNPHSTTASQVGLGNVPNVTTNNQTPTFTMAGTDSNLVSGEKLTISFGKIAKAINSLISHIADSIRHITATERTNWNTAHTNNHTHSNKTILDNTTASYTTAERTKLSGIENGAEVNNISDTNATDLTDGGNTTLHYHATDRDRANHTGTQTASTISDFASTVRSTVLTGLSTATNAIISATDTVLSALGKLQAQITANLSTLTTHIGRTDNPHSVTKTQVGLGNVDNTADLSKYVRSAEELRNLFTTRPTSANLPIVGDGSLKEFKATSSMTDGKPPQNAHVLHFEWDNAGGYNSQLAIENGNGNLYFRGMFGGVWKPWYMVYSQYSKQPDVAKLTTARTISLTGDVTGSVSFDGSANVSITSTVVDDSHNHVISNVDNLQTTLDSKLNSSAYNATDVLTKIKTVDGSGSGLDADTVDTYHVNNTLNTGSLWTSDKILSTVETYGSHFDRLVMARNRLYAGTNGIYGNQLIMQKTNGQWESLTSTHSSGISKTKNASGFLLSNILLYTLGATVTSGNLTDTGNNYVSFDNHTFQYSSNCGTTLTAYKSLYLKGTIVNGLFYLADIWWSQTLPTSDDGYVYVYLGETTNTTNFSLYPTHPIYKFVNGYLRNVTDYSLMSVGTTTSIEWN